MINRRHSGTLKVLPSEREKVHRKFARKAAAEGMVLLKNEGLLPLGMDSPIALFGGGAVKTVKGGTGSGDVNNRKSISVYQGIKRTGVVITSENWLADYEKRYESARAAWKEIVLEAVKNVENPFDAYAQNPFLMPEGRGITEEDIKGASAVVYVISRISGEGRDRRREEGDYYLSRREREDILYLEQTKIPIILLLNVGAPIELTDIMQEAGNIKAVLNISLPGQEGGCAAADVLFGRVTPSGRLTATWARRYNEYPSAEDFGYLDGNLETEYYKEGIYVGYRYFSSFGIKPLFPFGFGLSYTTFSIKFEGLQINKSSIDITVSVKNTGNNYFGRQVVQVYASPPQTGSVKEYQRLIGFGKTENLKPQESQELVISIEQSYLASYSEQLHAWIIEGGTYGIWIGESAESLRMEALLTVKDQTILAQTKSICPLKTALDELCQNEAARTRADEWLLRAEEQRIPRFLFKPQEEKKKFCQEILAKEQSVTELIPILYGNITHGASTLGSSGIRVPGSAGETTEALEEKYGIRSLIMADGPAGLRLRQSYQVDRATDSIYGVGVLGALENGYLDETKHYENSDTYYQYCTAFPVGTALAQSWDVNLMREFGEAVAIEMEEFQVDLWLAPGMNIHRNPLCGRNFEYYSEDPLLSGTMAGYVIDGVQCHRGCGVTVKHFACNNQEDNRMGVNVCISERALREIYLRGFGIAIKKSMPVAMMSAYNLINGVHAANSRDICTTVAREEWGFEGVIISDWNTTVPKDGSVPWQCIAAGNDIIMPGNTEDDKNIRDAYKNGKLSEEMIRRSAGRVLKMIQKLAP